MDYPKFIYILKVESQNLGAFRTFSDAQKSFFDTYTFLDGVNVEQKHPWKWNILEEGIVIGSIERLSFFDGYVKL